MKSFLKQLRSRRLLAVLCCLCFASPLLAASGDVFLGYSRIGANAFGEQVSGLNGWEGAMHIKWRQHLGFEGDISQYGFGAEANAPRTTLYLFGPRLSAGLAGVKLYAHALGGGAHTSLPNASGTNTAFAVGGGLEFPLAPFFAWRFAGDYLGHSGTASGNHPGRFGTGLVFKF